MAKITEEWQEEIVVREWSQRTRRIEYIAQASIPDLGMSVRIVCTVSRKNVDLLRKIRDRDETIRQMARDGRLVKEVAQSLGLAYHTVQVVGRGLWTGQEQRKISSERNEQIGARLLAGASYKDIAKEFGISPERVRQIGCKMARMRLRPRPLDTPVPSSL